MPLKSSILCAYAGSAATCFSVLFVASIGTTEEDSKSASPHSTLQFLLLMVTYQGSIELA